MSKQIISHNFAFSLKKKINHSPNNLQRKELTFQCIHIGMIQMTCHARKHLIHVFVCMSNREKMNINLQVENIIVTIAGTQRSLCLYF